MTISFQIDHYYGKEQNVLSDIIEKSLYGSMEFFFYTETLQNLCTPSISLSQNVCQKSAPVPRFFFAEQKCLKHLSKDGFYIRNPRPYESHANSFITIQICNYCYPK